MDANIHQHGQKVASTSLVEVGGVKTLTEYDADGNILSTRLITGREITEPIWDPIRDPLPNVEPIPGIGVSEEYEEHARSLATNAGLDLACLGIVWLTEKYLAE